MRVGLLVLILFVGCVATVGAAPKSADDKVPPNMEGQKALSEAPVIHPTVPLDQLVDQIPDGGIVIELYKSVRTIGDVESVNEYVKAEVVKAQSIVADIARLHAATVKSCDGSEAPQVEKIAGKARSFSTSLVRVDAELTKSLAATRREVEAERPNSFRAKEDLNRIILAVHELGRLRVQAEEIAKSVAGLGVSIRTTAASCSPTSVHALFAERNPTPVAAHEGRSPAMHKRVIKPAAPTAPRFAR